MSSTEEKKIEEAKLRKTTNLLNFPQCAALTEEVYKCEKQKIRGEFRNDSNAKKLCKEISQELTFCILGTFCSKEAINLRACMGKDFPNVLPQCSQQFDEFDSCMIKKTSDFERELEASQQNK
jgi:hypothetical protein